MSEVSEWWCVGWCVYCRRKILSSSPVIVASLFVLLSHLLQKPLRRIKTPYNIYNLETILKLPILQTLSINRLKLFDNFMVLEVANVVIGAAAAAHEDVVLGGVGYGGYFEWVVVGGDLEAGGGDYGHLGAHLGLILGAGGEWGGWFLFLFHVHAGWRIARPIRASSASVETRA